MTEREFQIAELRKVIDICVREMAGHPTARSTVTIGDYRISAETLLAAVLVRKNQLELREL